MRHRFRGFRRNHRVMVTGSPLVALVGCGSTGETNGGAAAGGTLTVFGVADYSLIPKLMFTGTDPYASWYVGFVSNQITFAYADRSRGAGQLTPANRYRVLAQPGVRIGRSNPGADPSGYQALRIVM